MKRLMLGCAFASLTIISVAVSADDSQHLPCFPVPHGITSWWPGDGNGADIVGGHTATLVDDATTSPGLVDEAFTLDGAGDFIEVPPDPGIEFGTKDFTVDLWVKFNTTAGEQVLIEKWVQRFGNPSHGWSLTKLEDNRIRLALAAEGTDTELDVDSPPLDIPLDTWVHLATRRSQNQFSVLLNGQPIAAASVNESVPFDLRSDSSLKFGHRCSPADTPGCEDPSGFYLNGQIDEVQLYVGHAVPWGLIRAIYLAGARGMCKSTVH